MATWYISPTGDDGTGDGSSGNPYATMGTTHDAASADDTIIYLDGTYLRTTHNQLDTITKNLTIEAETNGSVILDGEAGSMRWISDATPVVTVTGITFQNYVGGTSYTFALTNVTYNNCWFKDCYFTNSNDGYYYAGLFGKPTPTQTYTYFTFNRCLFTGAYVTNAVVGGAFISPRNTTATTVMTNCTWYFDTASACDRVYIFGTYAATNAITVTNCIFHNDTGEDKFDFDAQAIGADVWTYNDFYLFNQVPGGTGEITSDPLFVDQDNLNFNLRPTSPAIDTGTLV